MPGGSPASTRSASARAPPVSRSRRRRPRNRSIGPAPTSATAANATRVATAYTSTYAADARLPPALKAATGSTTHPAWATVDQASRRVASSWRRAMTLPRSIEAPATRPSTRLTRPASTSAPATAWTTTRSAAAAEIFEVVARAEAVPRSAVE